MFKKYKWSNWEDINTGAFSNVFYLLQARRRNDGKVEFRVAITSKKIRQYNKKFREINKSC